MLEARGVNAAETDLPALLQSWRQAGQLDWITVLAVIGLALPTALTLYGEMVTNKSAPVWAEVAALAIVAPLLFLAIQRHWSRHRISCRIVNVLFASGQSPTGLFERLTEESRRSVQCRVLSSVPLFPGELTSVAEVIADDMTADEKVIARLEATVIFDLFQSLGLLERRAQNRFAAVSEHAAALLHCIALGVRERAPFLTNWRIKDVADPAFQRAFAVISEAEENRRRLTPASHWMPVRKNIPVSIIIIKARRDGVDEVLVRWSAAWTTYNWVGGTQETADIDAEACAWREMNEELGLDRSGTLALDRIGSVVSGPIKSARLGVYSTWNYTVFSLNARAIGRNVLSVPLSRIIAPSAEFEVFTDQNRLTKIRWLKWSEVASETDFAKYGPELTSFLIERFGGVTPTFAFDLGVF